MPLSPEAKRQRRADEKAARDAANAASGIVPQPRGQPPPGKVWDTHVGAWVAGGGSSSNGDGQLCGSCGGVGSSPTLPVPLEDKASV